MTVAVPALSLRGISKHYAGVPVLVDIDLDVMPGHVHALLGSNGAGKSTLVKIVTGVVAPDPEGSLSMWGERLSAPYVDGHRHGLAVIHQDLGLVDSMTVLENLGISSRYDAGHALGPIGMRRQRRLCGELLDEVGLDVDADDVVSTLSPAQRAGVAIARARRLMGDRDGGHLFILDEPTAYLNAAESDAVMSLMRRVADTGSAVIFISHRLNEVVDVADHVSVLRDGRVADAFPIAEGSKERMISAMLGRTLEQPYPTRTPQPVSAERRVEVRDVAGAQLDSTSFVVRAGEILGCAGLVGMGHDAVPYVLAGGVAQTAGQVLVDGVDVSGQSVRERVESGVVLVPGNRQRDGLWPDGTAEENVLFPQTVGARLRPRRRRHDRRTATRLLDRFGVVPPDPDRLAMQYSGGNQQKVVLAKWLSSVPRVLLLDEPTQGVDVGAKLDVLTEVANAARQGCAVVMASGDYEQLAAICHRVLVFKHGRVVAELAGERLTEAALATAVHR